MKNLRNFGLLIYNSRIFYYSFLFIFFILSNNGYFSQNLPPDVVLKTKPDKIFNLSDKLNLILECNDTLVFKATFLKENLSQEDLSNFYTGATLDYYSKAMIFYNQLSPKVKAVLTRDELWDVYFYDQNGVITLLNIK